MPIFDKQLAATREGDDQLLAEARHPIQQRPELAAGNAQQTAFAPRATAVTITGRPVKQVDVAGKLPRLVSDDDAVAVRRIANLDLTGFDNV